MRIVSKPFLLNPDEYQRLLFSTTMRKRKWLYIALILIGIALLFFGEMIMGQIAIGYGLFGPLVYAFYFYRFSKAPENKILFSKRILIFEKQYFRAEIDEENKSTINWNSIVKVNQTKKYYLFYISKEQFIIVPKHIFYSEADAYELRKFLLDRGLINKVLESNLP